MKKTLVEEVMTKKVVFAREDTPFKEIAGLMAEYRVSGLPVLDDEDKLVGIVSEGDLLEAEDERAPTSPLVRLIEGRWLGNGDDLRARDVMIGDVVTVRPTDGIDSAARLLLRYGIKRVPVVDSDGHVLGIVSRTDVLRPYLRRDEDIRREIEEDVILDTMWIDPSTIEVTVDRGVVTLEGEVETKSTRHVLERLVHNVAGVIGIRNRLASPADDRPSGPPGELVETHLHGRGSLDLVKQEGTS